MIINKLIFSKTEYFFAANKSQDLYLSVFLLLRCFFPNYIQILLMVVDGSSGPLPTKAIILINIVERGQLMVGLLL